MAFVMTAQADQYTRKVISCIDSESLEDVEECLGQHCPLVRESWACTIYQLHDLGQVALPLGNGISNTGMEGAWYWAWHVAGTL